MYASVMPLQSALIVVAFVAFVALVHDVLVCHHVTTQSGTMIEFLKLNKDIK